MKFVNKMQLILKMHANKRNIHTIHKHRTNAVFLMTFTF